MSTPASTKTTFVTGEEKAPVLNFDAIRLRLASPDDIHRWSHGEVTKPETINYRTQKPEKSGLFDERIFGPSKDWECYCGKYKRIRYKGIICDKCGVEVTRSLVRRERMGHIDLATPVSHIWFLRGIPSKIGLMLDLPMQDLEKVIYFASYVILEVHEELRQQTLEQIKSELKVKQKALEQELEQLRANLRQRQAQELAAAKDGAQQAAVNDRSQKELAKLSGAHQTKLDQLQLAADTARRELRDLTPLAILSEQQFHELSLKYGHVFEAGIGAEAVRQLLSRIDLKQLAVALDEDLRSAIPSKQKRVARRSALVKNLLKNRLRPEWMILATIPVIPPDLRPMVQLDGGRFATSDLNDLYRRVINRNNRLRRLQELKAPEVIQRNEKRMLQEAVDALIDNSARHGKTVTASTGQKRMLKSIADILKGKQGRFRQNLLGKRIDYSGRSVIVVGPHLRLNQCGLPKRMALELFKPFVIAQLIARELVHNVRSANRYIEAGHAEVWDILEEVTRGAHVLLNRAPTLHRLGIQAFQPILIEGKAIQIHPLVCQAFNADFDGDQMAVHVPLTEEAKWEARELMLSTRNLLKPATGDPIVSPHQDMILGVFYMTFINPAAQPQRAFADPAEAKLAFQLNQIGIQDSIRVRHAGALITSSVGRLIFSEILPTEIGFQNATLGKKELGKLVGEVLERTDPERTVLFLDRLKNLSFDYLTRSGLSWGMGDMLDVPEKQELLRLAEAEIDQIQEQYDLGLLTEHERYVKVIELWAEVSGKITTLSKSKLKPGSSLHAIITSGARGSWSQLTQIIGMKGLVVNPAGDIIELPVKANFKEGLDVLEYFISTHGTRKGLSDTALRTANAGYLTRRLIDVSQDVVISEADCGDDQGLVLTRAESEAMATTLAERAFGRVTLSAVKDPETKKVLVKKGALIDKPLMKVIAQANPAELVVRSVLTCRTVRGLCQACYGYDLAYLKPVELGVAVGIIAAQSIGEPGTQLTMRTFHTGGVAGAEDVTQGLPRVEELFEVRPPKRKAVVSDVAGQVRLDPEQNTSTRYQRLVKVLYRGNQQEEIALPAGAKILVEDGQAVRKGAALYEGPTAGTVKAEHAGTARLDSGKLLLISEGEAEQEFTIPPGLALWVKEGYLVNPGDPLTEGSLDLQELFHHKGQLAVQQYLLQEIEAVYSAQGGRLNDKHIEIIARQIFSRCYVKDTGDTALLAGEVVPLAQVREENAKAEAANGRPAEYDTILLGITKASLSTDSFLSAASFQETARVLIDAAINGKVDLLRGLKENVIIGRLIPAGTGYHKFGDLAPELLPKAQPKPSAEPVIATEMPAPATVEG